MRNIFTEHPQTVNETYFQHAKFAFSFGFNMFVGGVACMLHSIFPFIFEKTGSHFLIKCMHRFVARMPQVDDENLINIGQLIQQKSKTGKIDDKNKRT